MSQISARRRAIIVGGSLGGMFAANLLVRNGWDVDVFERVGELTRELLQLPCPQPDCISTVEECGPDIFSKSREHVGVHDD